MPDQEQIIDERVKSLRRHAAHILGESVSGDHGSGGGGSDGMEARMAKVEACVEFLQRDVADIRTAVRDLRNDGQRDFRITFGALIAVALGLAGLMAKGFHWL